jgi:enediyne biosynthesis protein E4
MQICRRFVSARTIVGTLVATTLLYQVVSQVTSGQEEAQTRVATGNDAVVPVRPLPPGMKPPKVRYEDTATTAGLTGVNVSGAVKGREYITESTGDGVAIFDYDKDGLPDIFFVNGGRLQGKTVVPARFFPYHNLGGLKFQDVTAKAGPVNMNFYPISVYRQSTPGRSPELMARIG